MCELRRYLLLHQSTPDMLIGKASAASGVNVGSNCGSTTYTLQSVIMFVVSALIISVCLCHATQGRDEVFLCSLSNFDAYYITRLHKSPRPFAFAVRSTDNLSFFENTADYLHVFCCSDKEGQVWMEKILVARVSAIPIILPIKSDHAFVTQSYVLHQERNVLFNPKASSGNAAGGALARAGTRKGSSARPPQPLVAASPHIGPLVSLPRNEVFEPGSLLHKHI